MHFPSSQNNQDLSSLLTLLFLVPVVGSSAFPALGKIGRDPDGTSQAKAISFSREIRAGVS